jgi:hypothetical protein
MEFLNVSINKNRPHSTLDFLTPKEFAQKEEDILLESSNS